MNEQLSQVSSQIEVGDRIRFTPGPHQNRWWTVRARNERFIVATMQAPFQAKGKQWYTVVDLTGWATKFYNGAGRGVVRSSLDTLGGGWDIGPNGEGCDEVLAVLVSGDWELSHRRILSVWSIERHP